MDAPFFLRVFLRLKKAKKGEADLGKIANLEKARLDRKIASESDNEDKRDIAPNEIVDRFEGLKELMDHIQMIAEYFI